MVLQGGFLNSYDNLWSLCLRLFSVQSRRVLKFKLDKRKLRDETRCTLADLERRAEELMAIAKTVVAGKGI